MYPKQYRRTLGFNSQDKAKIFFAAKDIAAAFDLAYARELNARIANIFRLINDRAHQSIRWNDIDQFVNSHIEEPFRKVIAANISAGLNNNGRRPEEVLFSWMRGYAAMEYFAPAISQIIQVDLQDITRIGNDDWRNPDTFSRSATADLEVNIGGAGVRIEVQSGFQGENDVKEHKVKQAWRVMTTRSLKTVCIHLDLFNGRAAFLRLDSLEDSEIVWVSKPQMEGTKVFKISEGNFKWRILEKVPQLSSLGLDL